MLEIAFGLADVEEIGWAEPVYDGLHTTGLLEVIDGTFQFGSATGDAEQGDEMAAGGCAPGDEFVRVEVVFFGIRAEPADGSFAVVDLGGEFGFLTQAVSDLGDCVTVFQKAQSRARIVFAALHPCAAMNPDDEWEGFFGFFGKVQIKVHSPTAGVAIFQVLEHFCSGWERRLAGRLCRELNRERREKRQAGDDWFHDGSVCAEFDLRNGLGTRSEYPRVLSGGDAPSDSCHEGQNPSIVKS